MKAQNKLLSSIITAVLLITIFIPHFVWAEEIITVPENPVVEPVPTVPEVITSEPAPEIPVSETPITETPITETVTVETPTTTESIASPEPLTSEPATNTLTAQPVSSSQLTIRIGNTIIYSGYYTPGTEQFSVTDNASTTHQINPNTVLAMIIDADTHSDDFAITDLAYYSSFGSFIINCITTNGTASCNNWQYTVDDVYPYVGIDDATLGENSEVYLYFGEQNRFTLEDDTVALNQPVIVSAQKYDYKTNTWVVRPHVTVGATVANPADPWTPLVTTSTISDEFGQAHLYLTATGTVQIGIKEDSYYPTQPVTARIAETSIVLNVQTPAGEFFKQTVTVTACPLTLTSQTYTLNAWCAVEQTGATHNWTVGGNWFGSDVFLNQINEHVSDFATNKFWSWYHDLEAGQTGLNSYLLTPNEEVLLTFGVNPLKITTSARGGFTGEKITITISEQDFSDWNVFPSPWVPLTTSSTLHINETDLEIGNGIYEFTIPGSSDYVFSASKSGYAPSNRIIIGGENPGTPEPTPTENQTNSGGSTTNPPSNSAPANLTFDLSKAADYLYSQQKANGAIGSASLYSDWAAIALGSLGNSDSKNNLLNYLKTDPAAGSNITDYERRAMALLALGLNPYSDTNTNYIAKITSAFDGNQFGDPGLVNDDIFALFPLLKSGYSVADPEIQKSVQFIISRQNNTGGWESPDLTAAAIQGLSLVKSLTGVNESLVKAKNYLLLSTNADGKIGDNTFSTSWGTQALSALSEPSGNSITYLAKQQQADGGLESLTTNLDTRIWSTSYAIPAALGKTWNTILTSVSKPIAITPITPVIGITVVPTSTVPTVPLLTPSSTPELATTTPPLTSPKTEAPLPEPEISLATPEETPAPTVSEPVTSLTTVTTAPIKKTTPTPPPNPITEELTLPTSQNSETPASNRLFQGAATVAGTMGAYLAWRFIQSLA